MELFVCVSVNNVTTSDKNRLNEVACSYIVIIRRY